MTDVPTRTLGYPAFTPSQAQTLARLKTCLWLYIVLVFLEGPLRKWVVPSAATALLIARDPVVLVATFYGLRLGLFHNNRFLAVTSWLGLASVVVSLLVGGSLLATLYGWRTDFFHVPMAILIARVFTREDLEKLSRGLLALALPMGLLMAVQFRSPPNSWINAGLDEQFKQIGGLQGDLIRPPGTFSFITGPAIYFPLVLACLLAPLGTRSTERTVLRACAFVGIAVGTVFSESRSLWSGETIVLAVYLLSSARYRRAEFLRWVPAAFLLILLVPVFLEFPSVARALQVFSESRVGGETEHQEFLGRILSTFTKPFDLAYGMPLFGSGLGVGTIIGSQLQGAQSIYAYGDAETEMLRHFIESGIVLGSLYALLRICALVALLLRSLTSGRGGDPTALLFWSVAAPAILGGQIGQSTTLGTTVLAAGLTLLAIRHSGSRAPWPNGVEASST